MKKTVIPLRRRAALFCLCLCMLLSLFSCGKSEENNTLPEASELFYVYDEANVLDSETENYIVARNDALFALTGAQVVVACVSTTGYLGTEDYTTQLFNKWAIGSAEKNNGVLLLLTIDEQDYWCQQGKGLEDILSSGTIKLILNQYLEPDFAAGQYANGVRKTLDAITDHLETLYSVSLESWDGGEGAYTPAETGAQDDRGDREQPPARESNTSILAWAVIIVIVILLIISFSGGGGGGPRRQRRRTIYTTPRTRPYSYGTQMPPITRTPPRPTGQRPPSSPRPGSSRPSGGSFGGSFGGSRSGGSFGGSFGGSRSGGSFGGSRSGGSFGGSRSGGSFGGSRSGGGGFSRGGGAGRR